MNRGPSNEEVDLELEELGIRATDDTRKLLRLIATDPHALYTTLRHLSESEVPSDDDLPDVDASVEVEMRRAFSDCSEVELLVKPQRMGIQCKRLLGLLLKNIGEPVPLPELLLANGLKTATPRRLRELELEHGCFKIRTFAEGGLQYYVLEEPVPDLAACASYWLKRNIRDSSLSGKARLLALLTANLGQIVSIRGLNYVLPEEESQGRGRARDPLGTVQELLQELRATGLRLEISSAGAILLDLPRNTGS